MFRLIAWLVRKLSLSRALALGRAIGWLWYHVIPIRRGVARRNLRAALGDALSPAEQRRVARASFAHLGMTVIEELRAGVMTRDIAQDLVRRTGFDDFERALHEGKGIIAVMSHVGNFEMAGASQSLLGIPVNAVVRDIHFGAAHALWNELRHTTGMKTIPPRNSNFQIRAALRRGEPVAFLIDQHMPKARGIVCSFFGRLASTSPAPVRFALMTGAPILPVVIYRDGAPGHHMVEFHPRFALEMPYPDRDQNIWHNTERLNRIIEGWIRRAPEQWLWVHRRWKVHDQPAGWDIPESLKPLAGRRY